MGLYDEIIFPRPIKCKVCGVEINSTQTKLFDNLLVKYSVGDPMPKAFLYGVIRDTIYCNHGKKEGMESSFDQEIFLAIWQGILIDVLEDAELAMERVNSFGLEDLLSLSKRLLQGRNKHRYRYFQLKEWAKTILWSKPSKESLNAFLKDLEGQKQFDETVTDGEEVAKMALEYPDDLSLRETCRIYEQVIAERNKYRYCYLRLKDWTRNYAEYLELPKEKIDYLKSDKTGLADFHMSFFVKEMEDSEDPLEEFLEEIESRKCYDNCFFF